ncbi:MAG: hypothetical protein ACKPGT_09740, partial [Microcystis sp.]
YKLKFDGYNLKLYNGSSYVMSWAAISGQPGSQSPLLSGVKDVGPIPEGSWSFNMSRVQTITAMDDFIRYFPDRRPIRPRITAE